MKLEQQVCNLELAKRLKELGVKQESYFHWVLTFTADEAGNVEPDGWELRTKERLKDSLKEWEMMSAFTVAELGEMLPRFYETHRTNGLIPECEWTCANPYDVEYQIGSTEADVRAQMLVYLLENKLITL